MYSFKHNFNIDQLLVSSHDMRMTIGKLIEHFGHLCFYCSFILYTQLASKQLHSDTKKTAESIMETIQILLSSCNMSHYLAQDSSVLVQFR